MSEGAAAGSTNQSSLGLEIVLLQDCLDPPSLGEAQPVGVREGEGEEFAGPLPVAGGDALEEVEGELDAGGQEGANVAEAFKGRELFLLADAHGFVELAAGAESIRDLALSSSDGVNIAEALEDRQRFLLEQMQCVVEPAVGTEDASYLTPSNGGTADVAETLEGG